MECEAGGPLFAAFLKEELLENVGHCLWTFTIPKSSDLISCTNASSSEISFALLMRPSTS